MNRFRQWPAALLSLAAFGAAATAQEPTTPAAVETPAVGPGALPGTKPTPADMREDVEILRRLLDQALLKAYGLPAGKTDGVHSYGPVRFYPLIGQAQLSDDATRPSAVNGDHAAPNIEGVYLKDYGAVYTATLPSPTFDPVAGSKVDAGGKAPLDPWERTRKELRGETPEPEGKAVSAHQPLSEVILKVLAENGRHFTALADGERISVAVTFRGAANCANCHQSATWQNLPPNYYPYQPTPGRSGGMPMGSFSSPPGMAPPGGAIPGSFRPGMTPGGVSVPPSGSPPGEAGVGAPLRTAQEMPEWLTDVRNQILLGDLHMKQGKGQEAVAAYKAAMNQLENGMKPRSTPKSEFTPRDLPFVLIAVDIFTKTAQAYAAADDNDAAHKQLENASRLAKEAEKLYGGAAATANAQPAGAAAVPNKLIVTASKKLLDDVAAGKMTFEAFCKAATVEYTGDAGGNAPQPVQTAPGTGGR